MTGAREEPVSVADLRPVDLFDDLDDAALAEFAAAAEWRHAAAGDVVLEAGEPPEGMFCLLDGTLQLFQRDGDRFEPIGRQTAPTWIGAIAAVTEGDFVSRMVAISTADLALIPAAEFRRLALSNPDVHRRIMRQVRPIMTRMTAIQQNREHLAALGTMAAGLAHELNNPASAAKSAANDLGEALDVIGATLRDLVDAGIEREDAARIADLRDQALKQCAQGSRLSALDAADAEDEMRDRLEALGVTDAYRLAEPLAAAGVDGGWLEQMQKLAGPATPAALRSVSASLSAQRLVSDLRDSTERMSTLIGAIKAYAYMDRGGLVEADVHEGLETTLKVLGYKLKHTQIELKRDYDRTLPPLTMYGSEVNQVWTNLLDNAIDAVGESGTITVRTQLDGECIRVDIADTGPGIPVDARRHVFEPFYTTKGVGQGTGLGLDTVRRIVVDRHGGSVTFDTGDAGTTFHVWLPPPFHQHPPTNGERDMTICTHLDTITVLELPTSVDGCEDCLREGGVWLHLRICLECGHVGCCDDSPNRHATAHFHADGHPLIRSLQPGEDWSWCYVDEVAMVIPEVKGHTHIPPSPMLT